MQISLLENYPSKICPFEALHFVTSEVSTIAVQNSAIELGHTNAMQHEMYIQNICTGTHRNLSFFSHCLLKIN